MAKPTVQWKKRILLPIWTIRILLMLFMCLAFGLSIKLVHDEGSKPALGLVIFFFLLIVAVLLLDVLQVFMLIGNNLSPMTLLVISTVQAVFWGGVLLTDIIYVARDPEQNMNVSGIILCLGLFLLFLATLAYAFIKYTRQRREAKHGAYALAHNPATMPTMIPTPYTGPAVEHHNTAYKSPMQDGGDLGQQHIPYPAYGAQRDYYAEPPVKPANMV